MRLSAEKLAAGELFDGLSPAAKGGAFCIPIFDAPAAVLCFSKTALLKKTYR